MDEIAINPDHIHDRDISDVLATLAHEMVHLKQAHFGKPGRRGYHNREWSEMMEAIGLVPSNTGVPGGCKVGESMSHYVKENDFFDKASKKLLKQKFKLSWGDKSGGGLENTTKTKNGRVKYTCPVCELRAWAKPNINLICGECHEVLKLAE